MFPKHFHYEILPKWGVLGWIIDWTDITYSDIDLDVEDVKIELTEGYDFPLMKVDFPAIKDWEIDATQTVNTWILPSTSQVQLMIKDFDIDFQCDFFVDENGFLDPVVYDVDINWGESYLYHDNKIIQFVMHQWLYFGMLMVENSVYFVGDIIFSHIGGPLMDRALNDYMTEVTLASPFAGQAGGATFEFDFRNTLSPEIGYGYIDLYIVGEFLNKPNGLFNYVEQWGEN